MKCHFCERRCDLTEGRSFCGNFARENGQIKERHPDQWCTYSPSRIESVPFYHAYPGSRSMIIGTAGCNFRCRYCANGFIACQDPAQLQDVMYTIPPDRLVAMAKKMGCHNIVFNVNEPAVSLPSLERVKYFAQKEDIPWHVFRLLPEHNMKQSLYPNIDRMNQALETSRNLLPYIYFHNFVGSRWVNTLCPDCGSVVIKRFSLGCSGDRLDEFLAPDNTCTHCGTAISMLGTRVRWNDKQTTLWESEI